MDSHCRKDVTYRMFVSGMMILYVGFACLVVIPIFNYKLDVSNIKSGTVVDKYAESSFIGGSSFYLVLKDDDANIRYPFFIPEDIRKNTHSILVTVDINDKVSVGQSYDTTLAY